MRCVLALSPRAIEALKDITELYVYTRNDPDLDYDSDDLELLEDCDRDGMQFSRITQKALLRDEFKALEPEAQAAYCYRIAA